jgi:PAS domain S-box-containing protein
VAGETTPQDINDLCSAVKDPIRVVDKDLNIVWINEATRKIFGNNIVGRKCYEAFHQKNEPCEPYPCSTVKAFQDNKVSEFEIQDFDKSGGKAALHGVTNLGIRDEEGKLAAIIKITRDFTDLLQKKRDLEKAFDPLLKLIKEQKDKLVDSRKKLNKETIERQQIEREQRECENRFRVVVENSPVGICIIQQNKIVYQNPSLKKSLGRLPERFTDNILNALEYIHPDDVAMCREAYLQISSGTKQRVEIDFKFYPLRMKGRELNLSYANCTAALINYQGEKAVLLNLVDLTRTKKTEQLLNIREKMTSLGHVAAGIAHEIRNPLTGINSYLYTLEGLCDGEIIEGEQLVLLKKIVSQFQLASDKIETVIKRVLDFSKPNPPEMKRIDLNQCIINALNLSSVMLRKEGITLEKSLAPDLPQCYADSHMIEQVMLNLINNAIWAMKKSSIAKWIQIESCYKKKKLCINVSDSGPGIPQKLRYKIFDPFFTTRPSGTGIGLSIVQRIIADHHGTIAILAHKNGGATFSIELPQEKRTRAR